MVLTLQTLRALLYRGWKKALCVVAAMFAPYWLFFVSNSKVKPALFPAKLQESDIWYLQN